MRFSKDEIGQLALKTFTEPRAAAVEVMGFDVPRQALWPALAAVVLVSTIIGGLLNLISPAEGPLSGMVNSPFISAAVTYVFLVASIFGLHWAGRSVGGVGQLDDMVLVMTWFQVVTLAAQLLLLFVGLALPALGAMLFLGFMLISIWVAVSFIDAVHGFDNLAKSLGVLVFALIAIAFGLALLLSLFGVGPMLIEQGAAL